MADFRSDPMPSAEGKGFARDAWDKYQKGVEKALGPVARDYAFTRVNDLVGFWVLWHLLGGFEGLQKMGMPRTTIFRKIASFRKHFGYHPDIFVFDGIDIHPEIQTLSIRLDDGTKVPMPVNTNKRNTPN